MGEKRDKERNKFIVTTTINKPTKAILEFAKREDWILLIVGDMKTPHKEYEYVEKNFQNVRYLSPKWQEEKYSKLSNVLGWNSIERRNIGLLESYNQGAEIIATVDDDNIPYEDWGENIYVNKEIECDFYETFEDAFDPLSVTKENNLWHRGFPIELLDKRKNNLKSRVLRKVLVQADLWNGDPDIDAIARIAFRPNVNFNDIKEPFCSNKIAPFNSQNTFLSRKVLPFYSVLPFIGRMDDIWGSFILQKYFPNSVIYGPPTVYQERNIHNLSKDLEAELIGYKNSLSLIKDLDNFTEYLPEKTNEFWTIYRGSFG